MDDGRLGIVRRQENSHRKFICILNDVIKAKWTTEDDWLSREKLQTGVKFDKTSVCWRRKCIQQRVLQQCMKMRKDSLSTSDVVQKFGCYGGKPLYSYSRDIERYITEMHPRKRRERKVKKELCESIEKGKIVDQLEIQARLKDYFIRNCRKNDEDLTEKRRMERAKELEEKESKKMSTRKIMLPPLRGIVNNFHEYTLKDQDDNNEKEINQKLNQNGEHTAKLQSSNNDDLEVLKLNKTNVNTQRSATKGLLKLPSLVQENSKS